jgi:protein-S-isoprenylcysteine O-methyltransferase Ste14
MRPTFRHVRGTVGRWVAVSAALSAILSVAAGTTRLTSLCTYLAAFSVALLVAMLAVDPQLARERAHPGPDSSATNLRFASGFFFLMTLISASFLVGRAHTLIVPTAMRWIALATFISSSSPQTWAMVGNPYFSPVVRIQAERGHKLIHFGPYRFVRHPGYLAMCISVSASAVAIGSWLAPIPAGGFIAVVYERAKFEEQFLKANLSGYAQYAKTVPSGMFHSRST